MNAKAERIEQIIQVVNRNLQLVCTGQSGYTAPIEAKVLHRIDTSVFGNDKFAYEMLQYVKTSGKISSASGMVSLWDKHFLKGLETLLVECAVVKDELERDCFVGRVYSWFTEKVVERRDLPREEVGEDGLNDLKNSVAAMGGTHTVKALDKYMQNSKQNQGKIREQQDEADTKAHKTKLPMVNTDMSTPKDSARAPKSLPVYVRHAYPDLKNPDEDSPNAATPNQRQHTEAIPGSPADGDDNGDDDMDGETEAERRMNALFIAKRRQQAFEWKAKQQYALVMDRRALHLSRLESDALRRTESSSIMGQVRDAFDDQMNSQKNKFAPDVKRPFSAKRRMGGQVLNTWPESDINSPNTRVDDSPGGLHKQGSLTSLDANSAKDGQDDEPVLDMAVKMSSNGYEVETSTVPKAARNAVNRRSNGSLDSHSQTMPMRFRNELPEDYRRNMQRLRRYLQDESDSDNDDDEENNMSKKNDTATATASLSVADRKSSRVSTSPPLVVNGSIATPVGTRRVVQRPRTVVNERPHSAVRMRELAAHDSEMQVHYRHSNFRRMAVTTEIENWVDHRETQRKKKAQEKINELKDARAAKGKSGSSGKGGKSRSASKGRGILKEDSNEKQVVKYRSASQFMSIHFPVFDTDTSAGAHGPMRTVQLMECERIHTLLKESEIDIPLNTLHRGLLIPQDRPELVCAENLRTAKEGPMVNPLPPEFWRKSTLEKRPKSKKSGKRSKK